MADTLQPSPQTSPGRFALGVILNLGLAVWFSTIAYAAGFYSMGTDTCAPEKCDRLNRVVEFAYHGVRFLLLGIFLLASWKAWSRRTVGGLVLIFVGAAVLGPIIWFAGGLIVDGARR